MKWSHILVAVLFIALVVMLMKNSGGISGLFKWFGTAGSKLTQSVTGAG